MNSDKLVKPTEWIHRELKKIAEYQFGNDIGEILFPKDILVSYSRRTKKVKEIWLKNHRIASLRATDGYLSLGLAGAERILQKTKSPIRRVIVQSDVSDFIKDGRNVFAKHVKGVDSSIRPADEVIVVSEEDELLAVGKTRLSAEYMLAFEKGIAVNVRYVVKKLKKK